MPKKNDEKIITKLYISLDQFLTNASNLQEKHQTLFSHKYGFQHLVDFSQSDIFLHDSEVNDDGEVLLTKQISEFELNVRFDMYLNFLAKKSIDSLTSSFKIGKNCIPDKQQFQRWKNYAKDYGIASQIVKDAEDYFFKHARSFFVC